ncbi:thymidylate kinase [Nostoc phage A1]|nr:thymidylate kinase [Nostoc phage A1]
MNTRQEKPYAGTFIVFEGIDGAGKTTQANKAYEYLSGLKIPTILTCEPGGTQFGSNLRAWLKSDVQLTPRLQFLGMILDRLEHVNNVIRPQLLQGTVVLCDRFTWSTIAYQGALGLHRDIIDTMNRFATTDGCNVDPDLILLYDTELQIARERMKSDDRYEKMDDKFYTEVIKTYNQLGYYWDNCHVIDGGQTEDKVWETTKKWLDKILQLC